MFLIRDFLTKVIGAKENLMKYVYFLKEMGYQNPIYLMKDFHAFCMESYILHIKMK